MVLQLSFQIDIDPLDLQTKKGLSKSAWFNEYNDYKQCIYSGNVSTLSTSSDCSIWTFCLCEINNDYKQWIVQQRNMASRSDCTICRMLEEI